MLASTSRFIPDALLLLRQDDGKLCTTNTVGAPLQTDQSSGYWRVGGASIEQFAVNFLISSVTGSVTFAVLASSDPTFTAPTPIILARSGPVSATGHVVLGLARDTIDAALVALNAAVDVSSGAVALPTPIFITVAALVPAGSGVAFGAYQCELRG